MIKQTTKYGCGMYAVANACNMPSFVTAERLEASKGGNRIGQLSKWLQEDGHPYYIDVLYCDMHKDATRLPEWVGELAPEGDVLALPVLLNVRYSEGGLNHLVGGHITKDKALHLYDSLKDDIIVTTLSEVNSMYHSVYGLYNFEHIDGDGIVFIV